MLMFTKIVKETTNISTPIETIETNTNTQGFAHRGVEDSNPETSYVGVEFSDLVSEDGRFS